MLAINQCVGYTGTTHYSTQSRAREHSTQCDALSSGACVVCWLSYFWVGHSVFLAIYLLPLRTDRRRHGVGGTGRHGNHLLPEWRHFRGGGECGLGFHRVTTILCSLYWTFVWARRVSLSWVLPNAHDRVNMGGNTNTATAVQCGARLSTLPINVVMFSGRQATSHSHRTQYCSMSGPFVSSQRLSPLLFA